MWSIILLISDYSNSASKILYCLKSVNVICSGGCPYTKLRMTSERSLYQKRDSLDNVTLHCT